MRDWTDASDEEIRRDVERMARAMYDWDPFARRWPTRVPEHLMSSTSALAYVQVSPRSFTIEKSR